jgi:hypothetical protein
MWCRHERVDRSSFQRHGLAGQLGVSKGTMMRAASQPRSISLCQSHPAKSRALSNQRNPSAARRVASAEARSKFIEAQLIKMLRYLVV